MPILPPSRPRPSCLTPPSCGVGHHTGGEAHHANRETLPQVERTGDVLGGYVTRQTPVRVIRTTVHVVDRCRRCGHHPDRRQRPTSR